MQAVVVYAGLVVAGDLVFSSTIVSALVVMVAVTALLTLPLLKLFFERASNSLPEKQVQDEEVFEGSSKVLWYSVRIEDFIASSLHAITLPHPAFGYFRIAF